ncbi:nucleotidyltransferase domain-containing protein [Macrococcus carouselicus]|uniref:Amino acid transporter n=1 Tax=Macrococcus carouselicus TaxID=69969 RepID=A0A9Q8CKV6_9STAP|nr:hypothetical protein [Macrococcus carouselicus]TDM02469.1 hypothetical protein ERX40_07905 [Macrococcus carouselicus]
MKRTDFNNWQPYSVTDIKILLEHAEFQWAFAGGWAIDLYMGQQTRVHVDMDVVILSIDQNRLFDYLEDYTIFTAKNGILEKWNGQKIDDSYSLWVCKDESSPFKFEVMLIETEREKWKYKRDKRIQGDSERLFVRLDNGLSVLSPEIQLLYKLDASSIRDKDYTDYGAIAGFLTEAQKDWLFKNLKSEIVTIIKD